MQDLPRRSFLQLALAAIPASLLSQTEAISGHPKPVRVAAGNDCEDKKHTVGVSSTSYKVLTQDTGGALFVYRTVKS